MQLMLAGQSVAAASRTRGVCATAADAIDAAADAATSAPAAAAATRTFIAVTLVAGKHGRQPVRAHGAPCAHRAGQASRTQEDLHGAAEPKTDAPWWSMPRIASNFADSRRGHRCSS